MLRQATIISRNKYILGVIVCQDKNVKDTSARTGAKGRPRGERARTHAEARAERRGDVAEEVAAAGAAAVVGDGAGSIGAEPVAAQVAQRIDALHGETGQILHVRSPSGRPASRRTMRLVWQKLPWAARTELLRWILPLVHCGVKGNEYNRLWLGCGQADTRKELTEIKKRARG